MKKGICNILIIFVLSIALGMISGITNIVEAACAHRYNSNNICTLCGDRRDICSHKYSRWKNVDGVKHKRSCTLCGESQSGTHLNNNGYCSTCGYCSHSSYSKWIKLDNLKHVRSCNGCKLEKTGNHNYDETGKCTICNWTNVELVCKHKGAWKNTATKHTKNCSLCGELMESGSHTPNAGGYCSTCGYCSHANFSYDYSESDVENHKKICNGCGTEWTEPHDKKEKNGDTICTKDCGWMFIGLTCTVNERQHPDAGTTGDSYLVKNEFNGKYYNVKKCSVCMGEVAISEHTHSYSQWIKVNNDTHKKECNACGDTQTGNHTFDSTRKCTICNWTNVNLACTNHTGSWKYYNKTTHRKNCSSCGELIASENHNFNDGGYCSTCGYCSHKYKWESTSMSHTKKCLGCGRIEQTGSHTIDPDSGVCMGCGYCTHSNYKWEKNERTHTKVCRECGHKYDTEDHYPNSESCKDCGGYIKCNHILTQKEVVVENRSHKEICKKCNQTISSHLIVNDYYFLDETYDKVICRECGEQVDKIEHNFVEKATKEECSRCGFTQDKHKHELEVIECIKYNNKKHTIIQKCKTCDYTSKEKVEHDKAEVCACGYKCTHSKAEWEYTEDKHKLLCETCGKIEEEGNHVLNTSGKCECGYKYKGDKCSKNNRVEGHEYAETVYIKTSNTKHKIEEKCLDCGKKFTTTVNHDKAVKCVCGYQCEHKKKDFDETTGYCKKCGYCEHKKYGWESTSMSHTKKCLGCGKVDQTGSHTIDPDSGVCMGCGICTHINTEWVASKKNHQNICKNCGEILEKGNHSPNKETCTTCGGYCAHKKKTMVVNGEYHQEICSACKKIISAHKLEKAYDHYDVSEHAIICEGCEKFTIVEREAHQYSNGMCSVCGNEYVGVQCSINERIKSHVGIEGETYVEDFGFKYVRKCATCRGEVVVGNHEHTLSTVYSDITNTHHTETKQCTETICGFVFRAKKVKHDDAPVCVCGYGKIIEDEANKTECVHNYSSWKQSDKYRHERVCKECDKIEKELHYFVYGKCVCGEKAKLRLSSGGITLMPGESATIKVNYNGNPEDKISWHLNYSEYFTVAEYKIAPTKKFGENTLMELVITAKENIDIEKINSEITVFVGGLEKTIEVIVDNNKEANIQLYGKDEIYVGETIFIDVKLNTSDEDKNQLKWQSSGAKHKLTEKTDATGAWLRASKAGNVKVNVTYKSDAGKVIKVTKTVKVVDVTKVKAQEKIQLNIGDVVDLGVDVLKQVSGDSIEILGTSVIANTLGSTIVEDLNGNQYEIIVVDDEIALK